MGTLPRVLVVEYITSGGWPPGELPAGLAIEGAAMLAALLADFRAWGGVHTVTARDHRRADLDLPADTVVEVEPGRLEFVLPDLLSDCAAALIVAPETDGILGRLSASVEAAGVELLGSRPAGIAVAADKGACAERFRTAGLPTPETRRIRRTDLAAEARRFGFPLVVKPLDGAGCEGVCQVRSWEDLAEAAALLARATSRDEVLIQRFVTGDPASVSLLVTDDGRVRALSLNAQKVVPGRPFTYHGGVVPFRHPLARRALETAAEAVRQIPGLRGYVGVDLVLADGEAWLMEVNPRLTTAYVGLRRVAACNLARAIWDACRAGRLPEAVATRGQVEFIKTPAGIVVRRMDGGSAGPAPPRP